jgi:GT2 family glycosyltransferase
MVNPSLTTFIPYALDGNLGPVWNGILDSLPEGGWAAFLDHDAMFTTPVWYKQIVYAIKEQPLGTFSCLSNRIGQESRWQSVDRDKVDAGEHDIRDHRVFGAMQTQDKTLTDVTDKELMAGMFFVISKATFQIIGPFPNGLRGLDNTLHMRLRKNGLKLYCINGLYLYHWYRADGRNYVEGSLQHHPMNA